MKRKNSKAGKILCLALAVLLVIGAMPMYNIAAAGTDEQPTVEVSPSPAAESAESEPTGEAEQTTAPETFTEPTESAEPEQSASPTPTASPELEETTEPEPTAYANSISGTLWHDANEDGFRDSGEQPVADYPVYLYVAGDTDNAVQTIKTGVDGRYTFEDIEPGSYFVGVKSNELGVDEYLLPMVGVTGDNKFADWSDEWDEKYSKPIAVGADTIVVDINAGMRTPPGVQPMANTTYYLDIATLTGTAVTSGGVTVSGTVATFPNTLDSTDTYIITQSTSTVTANTILVSSGANVNITLQGVNMSTSGTSSFSPIRLIGTANVNLTLSGSNIVSCYNSSTTAAVYSAGIYVAPTAKLTIDKETSDAVDTLTATGGYYGAGIGGSYISSASANYGNNAAGTIIINGGTVTASGIHIDSYGAGIGGGYGGAGGTIIINGGVVNAAGGNQTAASSWYSYSAGIGGGYGGAGGSITINGGTVTAISSGIEITKGYGAAIGGGSNGAGGVITINGGNVTASSYTGAGIGGGRHAAGDTVEINSGTVIAASVLGAGIGGGGAVAGGVGNGGTGGAITINDGIVDASSTAGAGIGGGAGGVMNTSATGVYSGGSGGTITINGGTINAYTKTDGTGAITAFGSGIGGGGGCSVYNNIAYGLSSTSYVNAGSGGTITITGGTITASCGIETVGLGGAGIGGGGAGGYGCGGNGGIIRISGGTVEAIGGGRSAGIGGGGAAASSAITSASGSGYITISGGTVTATGGRRGVINLTGAPAPGIGCGGGTNYYSTATGSIVFIGGSILPLDYTGAINVRMNASTIYDDVTHSGGTPTNGSTYGAPDQVHLVEFTGYTAYDPFYIVAGGFVSSYDYYANAHPDGTVYAWLAFPGVLTKDATNITNSTATLNGEIYLDDTYVASSGYFEWGTGSGSYTSSTNITPTSNISGVDPYSANISGLTADTTYYYRLVIMAGGVTIYGNEVLFRTPSAITEHYLKLKDGSTLQSSVTNSAAFGSTFTGSPPATITSGSDTYTYTGYRLGSTTATLTGGNPSFTVSGSTEIYYYYIGPPTVTVSHTVTSGTTTTLDGIYNLDGGTFVSGLFEISIDGVTWTTPAGAGGTLDGMTTTPSVNLTGLTPGATYYYRLTVVSNGGTATATGSFTSGFTVTEKYVDTNGNALVPAVPDTTQSILPNGAYNGSAVSITGYVCIGYMIGSSTDTFATATAGTSGDTAPQITTVTADQTVWFVYASTTGSVTINKYSSDGITTLPGATFKLEKLDALGNVDTSFTMQTLTTGPTGTLTFPSLAEGEYKVTETAAPANHSLLTKSFTVTIPYDLVLSASATPTDLNYLYTTTNTLTGDVTYHYYNVTYSVSDQAAIAMPSAGVTGSTLSGYTLGGVLAVLLGTAGLTILLIRRRKYRAKPV